MRQSFVVRKIFIYGFNEIVSAYFSVVGNAFLRNFKSSQILQFSCIIFVKLFYDLFKVCIVWSCVHSSNWLCFISLSKPVSTDNIIIIIKNQNVSLRFSLLLLSFLFPSWYFSSFIFYCFWFRLNFYQVFLKYYMGCTYKKCIHHLSDTQI